MPEVMLSSCSTVMFAAFGKLGWNSQLGIEAEFASPISCRATVPTKDLVVLAMMKVSSDFIGVLLATLE